MVYFRICHLKLWYRVTEKLLHYQSKQEISMIALNYSGDLNKKDKNGILLSSQIWYNGG